MIHLSNRSDQRPVASGPKYVANHSQAYFIEYQLRELFCFIFYIFFNTIYQNIYAQQTQNSDVLNIWYLLVAGYIYLFLVYKPKVQIEIIDPIRFLSVYYEYWGWEGQALVFLMLQFNRTISILCFIIVWISYLT